MARVLLISPKYNGYIVAPHLGLGYLASALLKRGHSVRVIDGLREEVTYDPKEYDWVGLTSMTTYFPEMVEAVKLAKSFGLPTVIGGPHPIANPEQALVQSGADFACMAEGELLINELVEGKAPSHIEGLVYWKDGTPCRTCAKPTFYPDIDDFGEPAWDFIDPRSYPKAPHGMIARRFPLAPIITSRGCPYSCTYCSAPITAGKKMRWRSVNAVIDEIAMLHGKYGVREIQIEDDNFTIKRDRVFEFCEALIRQKLDVIWSLPNGVRIDRLDPDMLGLMKRSGCYLMSLGIESANQRILDLVKKRLNVELVRKVVGWVSDAGIESCGFFMIGFPTETREEIQKTVDFALSLPLSRANFTKVTPLPGTELYELWKQEYAQGEEVDWSTFNFYTFNPKMAKVNPEELSKIQRRANRKFYLKPSTILCLITRIRWDQYRYFFRRIFNLLGLYKITGKRVDSRQYLANPKAILVSSGPVIPAP